MSPYQPRNLAPRVAALDRCIHEARAAVTRAEGAVANWVAIVSMSPQAMVLHAVQSEARARTRLDDAQRRLRMLTRARGIALRASRSARASRTSPKPSELAAPPAPAAPDLAGTLPAGVTWGSVSDSA